MPLLHWVEDQVVSVFRAALEPSIVKNTDFVAWLFDKPWKAALELHTAEELLGFKPEEALFDIFGLPRLIWSADRRRAGYQPQEVQHYINFVVTNAEVFGERSGRDLDRFGRGLFHHASLSVHLATCVELKADWRVKDYRGFDAIEYCAGQRRMEAVVALLAAKFCDDVEFVAHCTPYVWGAVSSESEYMQSREPVFFKEEFDEVVQRLVATVPKDRWVPALTALVQIQLRLSTTEPVITLLDKKNPELRDATMKALFADHETVLWSDWFGHYQLSQARGVPVTHYLIYSRKILESIAGDVEKYFPSVEARRAWFLAKNFEGKTALDCLLSYQQSLSEPYNLAAFGNPKGLS